LEDGSVKNCTGVNEYRSMPGGKDEHCVVVAVFGTVSGFELRSKKGKRRWGGMEAAGKVVLVSDEREVE
jgi:hypothetical protein